jgi:hypothetical protein
MKTIKKITFYLIFICCSLQLAFGKSNLDVKNVIDIANKFVYSKNNNNLNVFSIVMVKFDAIEQSWFVLYQDKFGRLGGHFGVLVDDESGLVSGVNQKGLGIKRVIP